MNWVDDVFNSTIGSFYVTYRSPINIILIVVGAILANWILRSILMRTVTQVVRGVKKSQDVEKTSEIETTTYVTARAVQRTRTLGTVGRHVISWTIVVMSIILILTNLGVNPAALLTSAGIVAAGLAFGAQNIVKDILNGIFMVFEDQLGVGDVVTIGAVTGTVEDVGIRVVQLRSLDGTLWFIRNGEVLTLGNASQGWGRALIDVTVDAHQDLAHVSEVMIAATRALLKTERYANKATDEPELMGLESVSGDRATLRLAVRTRPEAQWEVQRGIRAELRSKFREENIKLADELPGPQGGKTP
jgi:small conductance mechanosensitive channel